MKSSLILLAVFASVSAQDAYAQQLHGDRFLSVVSGNAFKDSSAKTAKAAPDISAKSAKAVDAKAEKAAKATKSSSYKLESKTSKASSEAAQSTPVLSSTPPKRYLLNYEYIPDVLDKRGPYREEHLALATEMAESGACVSGGASSPPGSDVPTGALFVFTTKEAAEKFVAEDPYVSNGIVTKSTILEWTVSIGNN